MTTSRVRGVGPLLAAALVMGLGACGTAPSPTGLCDRYTELKASVAQARASVAPSATKCMDASP